jgi:peptidoglycan hydrolase CwlO-like protein
MEKQPTNPLTLADLQAALTGLATKDDLKALATQEALSALTTTVTTIQETVTTMQETVNAIRETVAGTKEDVTAVQEDMKAMEDRLTTGLGRIENLLLAKQEQRLNELEARRKNLEDALAV